jgi:hypothetical protein
MSDHIPEGNRCAIYTRQSRESTVEISSCQAHFEACLNFVRANSSLSWVWNRQRYDDDGGSGAHRKRPSLKRLFVDVETGAVDRVVYRLDRLCRSVLHSVQILQELRDRNVALTIVTSPELGASAMSARAYEVERFVQDLLARQTAGNGILRTKQSRRPNSPQLDLCWTIGAGASCPGMCR